jgi:hypothetical protein
MADRQADNDKQSKEPIVSTPRTPLGRRLREIREKIVASGVPLLTWEQIEEDLLERRGSRSWEETP